MILLKLHQKILELEVVGIESGTALAHCLTRIFKSKRKRFSHIYIENLTEIIDCVQYKTKREDVLPAVCISSPDDDSCSHLLAFDTFLGNTDKSKQKKICCLL